MKIKSKISGYILRNTAVAILLLTGFGTLTAAFTLPDGSRSLLSPHLTANPSRGTASDSSSLGGWSIVPSPNTGSSSNFLNDATCTSPSDCWAVGSYDNGNPDIADLTLIEHWDGTSWSIVSSPNPDTVNADLRSVTCTSASECWAVGNYTPRTNNGLTLTLIERWDGTAWTIISSPSPAQLSLLGGVTCTSPSQCWAVGWSNTGTIIERWDGVSWSVVSSPSPNTSGVLSDVTCASASQCSAVGFYYSDSGSVFQTLIELWDGTSWTIVPSPSTSTTQNNYLYGLACTSTSQCWAVGYYEPGNGNPFQTLIERWDGTSWTIAPSPNLGDNDLFDVACSSPSHCWAVGRSNGQTLVEQWDGASWTIASSSNVNGAQFHQLRGVTCSMTPQCWTVGWYEVSTYETPYQTLIERENEHPPFFSAEVSLGNGIYYLQFPDGTPFGYYAYLSDPHFIYHFDMGYEYWFDANDGHSGIFFYDFAANTFFYTSPSFPFPYLYDFGLNTILYYYADTQRPGHYTTNPRYFYNFATHQIITR